MDWMRRKDKKHWKISYDPILSNQLYLSPSNLDTINHTRTPSLSPKYVSAKKHMCTQLHCNQFHRPSDVDSVQCPTSNQSL